MENKKCICCHKIQPVENFKAKGWKSPYEIDRDSICDKCKRYNITATLSTEEPFNTKKKKGYYDKCYNITQEEYNFLFAAQQGKCKICKTHQTQLPKKLVVDHCHETGHVRGLLCNLCNSGLGMFKDNITSLEKALQYLRDTR